MVYPRNGAGLIAVLGLLVGCGAVYVSPAVQDDATAQVDVQVVVLDPVSIRAANAVPHDGKNLPAAYYAQPGNGSGLQPAGAAPEATVDPVARPGTLTLRLPPDAEPGPYRLGVGDEVVLAGALDGISSPIAQTAAGGPGGGASRQSYGIQDDGTITLPNVGQVALADLTLDEARRAVVQALQARQIDPAVSLDVSAFRARKVVIGGAVAKPGVVSVTLTPLYLDEALSSVGGVSKSDAFVSVRLYRDGQLYQIPLTELYGAQGLRRIRLQHGDSIFVDTAYDLDRAEAYFTQQIQLTQFRQQARAQAVALLQAEIGLRRDALTDQRSAFESRLDLGAVPRDYVYITGEVAAQNRFALPFDSRASLADALYSGGGMLTETANPAQIYVLRSTADQSGTAQGGVVAYHLNARNAVNLVLATQLLLRPNDIIFVSEQPITKWNRALRQVIPSLFSGIAK